jgi:hypothetical protein
LISILSSPLPLLRAPPFAFAFTFLTRQECYHPHPNYNIVQGPIFFPLGVDRVCGAAAAAITTARRAIEVIAKQITDDGSTTQCNSNINKNIKGQK